jgi:predicted transcriptional regulator
MLLNPRSAEYFEETRAKRFGMSLADLGKSDLSGEVAWKNAEPSAKKLADILKEKPGDFVLGEEVSFSDFVIGGMFVMLKLLDKNGDLYDRLVGMDDALKKHCQSVAGFFEKDN